MIHYLKSKNGDFELEVSMGCNHPNMTNNNSQSVGCDGDCGSCRYSIATTTIPTMLELLKRADCNYRS